MKSFGELKDIVQAAQVSYTEEELARAAQGKGAIKCRMYPSRTLTKSQDCPAEASCILRQRKDRDMRCALVLVETAAELRKKHWLE